MTKNPYISGIGGWLAFLVVGLMILGPLVGFGKLSNEFRDAMEQYPQLASNSEWQSYRQVSWIIYSVSAAISFSAGYRLWKIHVPESVRFAILALWLVGPLGNVMYIFSGVVIFGSRLPENEMAQMVGGVLGSCVAVGIWTAYLMRSVRVRNTYKTWRSAETTATSGESHNEAVQVPRKNSWWHDRSRAFRLWVFASITWAVATLIFVIAFDPYDTGSLSYMDDDEYFNMFFVMFVPPIFLGSAKYAYEHWVK